MAKEIEHGEPFDLYYMDRASTGVPGRFLPLPSKIFRDVPIYWRRDAADPSLIEISSPSSDPLNLGAERRYSCPSWVSTAENVDAWVRGEPLSAEVLNSIGWWLSFHWRDPKNPNWHQSDYVDWQRAREYFEKSADLGFWAAQNNLGVIYRGGFGVEANPGTAFEYFEKAGQQLDPISLRHLANCYRTGCGVKADTIQARYLEELAHLQEQEFQKLYMFAGA